MSTAIEIALHEALNSIKERVVDTPDVALVLGSGLGAFAEQLELLAPFGKDNPRPLFELADMTLNDVRFMGTENQHVRFTARDRQGRGIQCVLFNRGADYGTMLYAKRSFDLIGHLECQVWQGSKRLQFMTEKIL